MNTLMSALWFFLKTGCKLLPVILTKIIVVPLITKAFNVSVKWLIDISMIILIERQLLSEYKFKNQPVAISCHSKWMKKTKRTFYVNMIIRFTSILLWCANFRKSVKIVRESCKRLTLELQETFGNKFGKSKEFLIVLGDRVILRRKTMKSSKNRNHLKNQLKNKELIIIWL